VDEVKMYALMGRPDGETDALTWWSRRESSYPRLAKVAKKFFSIQASSSESERIFSVAGGILTEKRNSINPESVGDLVFYAVNHAVSNTDVCLLHLP